MKFKERRKLTLLVDGLIPEDQRLKQLPAEAPKTHEAEVRLHKADLRQQGDGNSQQNKNPVAGLVEEGGAEHGRHKLLDDLDSNEHLSNRRDDLGLCLTNKVHGGGFGDRNLLPLVLQRVNALDLAGEGSEFPRGLGNIDVKEFWQER